MGARCGNVTEPVSAQVNESARLFNGFDQDGAGFHSVTPEIGNVGVVLSTQEEKPPVKNRQWRTRVDSGLLLVLTLPWVILRLDTSWLFAYATSPFGFIDPWAYFGFFLDLKQHIRTFKGAYFTTRLTWTVPGAIVYRVFPPLTATYVLHLAVFYGAILSLYLILKSTVSRRAALLATILMAFHSYFLWSVGWPYIDGIGNTYLLLTMVALTFAARSNRPRQWLFAAGVLAAMAIYCQLFLIVFSPLVLGYYHFARRKMENRQPARAWKPFAWGFAAVTVIFGVFNMAINGRFLFFINSLGTAAKLIINHNPYKYSTYGWLAGASWLILPAITLVGALTLLARRKNVPDLANAEFILFWQRYYVLGFGIMLFWQVIGQPVLQFSHYSSYLMPGVFLALGSQLAVITHKMNRTQFALLCAGVGMVLLLAFILPVRSGIMAAMQRHALLLPLGLGIVAVAAVARRMRHVGAVAVLVLGLSLATLNATTGPRVWTHGPLPQDAEPLKAALLAIVDSVRTVQSLDPRGNLYFWYDGEGRLGHLYRSIASTYLWAYRLQSETFPALGATAPPNQRRILILAQDEQTAERQAKASLNQLGLDAELLARRTVHEGPITFDMIEIQITNRVSSTSIQPR